MTFCNMLMVCTHCGKPILDKYVLTVLDRPWHPGCVRCQDCGMGLNEKCFSRDGKIYCRDDFYRRFGPKCSGCSLSISPQDLVRKAREKLFHLKCFTCLVCQKQLLTGEELYVVEDSKFVCKEDYGRIISEQDNEDEELDDDDDRSTEHMEHNNNSLSTLSMGLGMGGLSPSSIIDKTSPMADSTDRDLLNDSEGSVNGDGDGDEDSLKYKSEDGSGTKRRGPRTTIKAKQLDVLKNAFNQTPKPTRHIREQLAKETGLPMRVIQVWFQNKRSKERRMKQLAGRGGGFFMGGKRIRGFGMGPPGHEDGRFNFYEPGLGGPHGGPDFGGPGGPGFPGGPRFPGDFFANGGGPGIPFNPAGPPSSLEQPLPMNLPPILPSDFPHSLVPLPPPPSENMSQPLHRSSSPELTRNRSPRPLGGPGVGLPPSFANQTIDEGIGVW